KQRGGTDRLASIECAVGRSLERGPRSKRVSSGGRPRVERKGLRRDAGSLAEARIRSPLGRSSNDRGALRWRMAFFPAGSKRLGKSVRRGRAPGALDADGPRMGSPLDRGSDGVSEISDE